MLPETSSRDALLDECRVLTRYVAGCDADDYVVRKYADLQEAAVANAEPQVAVDRVLVDLARRGAAFARIADAYARFFRPRGILRCKLVLLCAILENSPGYHRRFTGGCDASAVGILARLAVVSVAFGCALAAGLLVVPSLRWLGRHR